MKRFCLVFAALAALLIAGGATALASTAHPAKKGAAKAKTTATKVTCTVQISVQVPAGATDVTAGSSSGDQYGTAGCGKPIGSGVQKDSFDEDDSGNWTGKFKQYFGAGTLYGKFVLAPNDTQPPSLASFTAASYTGTLTVSNGTGLYKKATGKATMTCKTTDAEHYTCTDKLKLTLPKTS